MIGGQYAESDVVAFDLACGNLVEFEEGAIGNQLLGALSQLALRNEQVLHYTPSYIEDVIHPGQADYLRHLQFKHHSLLIYRLLFMLELASSLHLNQ